MEQNICLTLSYDGTNYVGWQRQPADHGVSVQQRVEEALSEVYREPVVIAGAGRTDSGVHALGQCCTFTAKKPVPVDKLAEILNGRLPEDIRILAAWEVEAGFHARFSATGKRYRYTLEQGRRNNPFNSRYTWQLEAPLDIPLMREAAATLLGYHDFRNYTLSGVSVTTFDRTIRALDILIPEERDARFPWETLLDPVVIEAEADGFLYKMVRIIVGRLVAVGQHRITLDEFRGFLDGSFDRNIPPAPARGLMMLEVHYGESENQEKK